jgi:hypothetical protein
MALAKSDFERAFPRAKEIEDSWYASQALAAVLRYAPESAIARVTVAFRKRANACKDDYQRSGVRGWAIRALAERDYSKESKEMLLEALAIARKAEPLPSRSEALTLLLHAGYPLGPSAIVPVVKLLVDTWNSSKQWRCERALVDSLALLAKIDREGAESFKARCPDPRIWEKMERALQTGHVNPRPFFW